MLKLIMNSVTKSTCFLSLRRFHKNGEIISWLFITSSDYAKNVTSYLTSENIEFIEKSKNTCNVPQARGIEKIWALP